MKEPIFSPASLRDIEEVAEFIARDRPAAAQAFIERVIRAADRLAQSPHMGTACDHLLTNARCLSVGRYIVYFRPHEGTVQMLRVVDGARDQRILDLDG